MKIENYLDAERSEVLNCMGGDGTLYRSDLLTNELYGAFDFVRCLVLPSGTSIGSHTHGNDVELYVILAGEGVYEADGERAEVAAGDVISLRPNGTHALYNTSVFDLRILAVQAKTKE